MNYREAEVLAAYDAGPSGTKVVDLELVDIISRLEVIFAYTVATDVNNTEHPAANITKLELVDGSDVLFSLSGKEAQAVAFYGRGMMPYNNITVEDGSVGVAVIPIDFGRYLWDREYAFDPSKFTNPQLKITYDEDVANASTTANSLEVNARIFDERKVSPRGFLMSKSIEESAMEASSHAYVTMPTDYSYRAMFLHADSTDHSPITLVDKIKLSEDTDKRIPLNIDEDTLLWMILTQTPRIDENIELADAVTESTFYVTPSELVQIIAYSSGACDAADADIGAATITGSKIVLSANVELIYQDAIVNGWLPHSVIPIQFGDQMDDSDWYDVTRMKQLKLDVTQSSDADSGDTLTVLVQQKRMYS